MHYQLFKAVYDTCGLYRAESVRGEVSHEAQRHISAGLIESLKYYKTELWEVAVQPNRVNKRV